MMTLVYIFFGILLAQLVYVAANWWQYKRADYVYYFFYLFLVIIYFMIIYQEPIFLVEEKDGLYRALRFFLRPTAFALYALYFSFVISFLDTATNFPRLHGRVLLTRNLLVIFVGVFLILNMIQFQAAWIGMLYLALSLLLFVSVVWLVFAIWKTPTSLSKYILRGALAAAIGAFISNILMLLYLIHLIEFPGNYMFPVAVGIIVEVFYFNSGLTYKSRQVEQNMIRSQQQLIEELEHSRDLENRLGTIRQKISRDLHDELGGGLSTIRLISEMARLKNDPFTDLEKISGTSRELVYKMNEIVWTMNVNNDNLQSLVTYIRKFAIHYLEELGIECVANVPDPVPPLEVEGFVRRNIFLCIKEALHNVVKHAGASQVNITTFIDEARCSITIHDNGRDKGVTEKMGGNGIINMQERMLECGGTFAMENKNGTTVYFVIPLKALSHKSVMADKV
ncbi:MAG: 7TM diverse intracellular signaling domain-containing protein [Bacteroidota bacterium]